MGDEMNSSRSRLPFPRIRTVFLAVVIQVQGSGFANAKSQTEEQFDDAHVAGVQAAFIVGSGILIFGC